MLATVVWIGGLSGLSIGLNNGEHLQREGILLLRLNLVLGAIILALTAVARAT